MYLHLPKQISFRSLNVFLMLIFAFGCGPVSRAKKIEVGAQRNPVPDFTPSCKEGTAIPLGLGPIEWPNDVIGGDQGRPFILATRKADFFPEVYKFAGSWQKVSPAGVGNRKLAVNQRPHLVRQGNMLYFMGYENLPAGTQQEFLFVVDTAKKTMVTRNWPAGTVLGGLLVDGGALFHVAYVNGLSLLRVSKSTNEGVSWTTVADIPCGEICEAFDVKKFRNSIYILIASPFSGPTVKVALIDENGGVRVEVVSGAYPQNISVVDRPELFLAQGEVYAMVTLDHGNNNLTESKTLFRRNRGNWTSQGVISSNDMLGDAMLIDASGKFFLYERGPRSHRLLEGKVSGSSSAVHFDSARGSNSFAPGSISQIWSSGKDFYLFGLDSQNRLVEQPFTCLD